MILHRDLRTVYLSVLARVKQRLIGFSGFFGGGVGPHACVCGGVLLLLAVLSV